MTTATIAAVREMYDGFARGDLAAVLAVLDPRVEWNKADAGTLRKNCLTVRAQFAHLFTFDDGRIVRFQQYTDTAQFALAVAARS
jgi:ketosteroid isomerase-like protein